MHIAKSLPIPSYSWPNTFLNFFGSCVCLSDVISLLGAHAADVHKTVCRVHPVAM